MAELKKLSAELTHYDPHIRQNAVIDFGKLFSDDNIRNSLKDEEKAAIVSHLLTRLEPAENSIEVKGRTVKVFSNIAKFLRDTDIVQIFDKIINYITNPKTEGKDIYVTCIKAILKEIPSTCCYIIGKVIIPILVKGINSQDTDILELCFDTFTDYIIAFDYSLIKESESVISNKDQIISIAIKHISSSSETLQSKVINFIGSFSLVMKQKDLGIAVEQIISLFTQSKRIEDQIAYFNTWNSIAKVSASKQIDQVSSILKIINQYANVEYLEKDSNDYDMKNNLVEAALNLFETIILKLNNAINIENEKVIHNNIALVEFDPNYSYDDQEEEAGGYDEYEGYEQVASMEDSAWKVRRAAVMVLESIIKCGMLIEREFKELIIERLVKDLREHDENTKTSIISCLSSYLKTLVIVDDTSADNQLKRMSSLVTDFIPTITAELINAIIKDLNGTNANIKTKILHLLPVLASIGAADLISAFDCLKSCFDKTCFSENSNTIVFFIFLKQLFIANKSEDIYTDIYKDCLRYIERGLSNEFYKVNIEVVNTCTCLIPILASNQKDNKGYIDQIYKYIVPKYQQKDIDQELRIALTNAIGELIVFAGSSFDAATLTLLFGLFLEKSKNEIVRPHIFSLLIKIMDKGKGLPLEKPISQFISLIIELIEKGQANIQFQVFILLEKIYHNYPTALTGNEEKIVTIILQLKHDDGQIPLIYSVFREMANYLPEKLLQLILNDVVNQLNQISIIGNQLNPLFEFTVIAANKVNKTIIESILSNYNDISKINVNISRFIGILASTCGQEPKFITSCLSSLSSNSNEGNVKISLILLGDVCVYSKQKHSELVNQLEKMIASASEDIKISISISIGKIGMSDPEVFCKKITSEQVNKYNILSLREFLSLVSEKIISINDDNLKQIYDWLNQSDNFSNDQLNKLCGECLGLITSYHQKFLPIYLDGFNKETKARGAYYYGLKFIFSNKKKTIPQDNLKVLIEKLILGLNDSDLIVKENAFNSLMTASHHYSYDIQNNYSVLMGILNVEHTIKKELIEEADFGSGLKIRNDKGLNIRKAVYATMKLFVDNFPQKINVSDTIQICLDGFLDTEDIQSISFGAIIKLAHLFHSAFIAYTDAVCERLKGVVSKIRNDDKLKEFALYMQRLFNEMRVEHEIEENPKFVNLNTEIGNVLKKYQS